MAMSTHVEVQAWQAEAVAAAAELRRAEAALRRESAAIHAPMHDITREGTSVSLAAATVASVGPWGLTASPC